MPLEIYYVYFIPPSTGSICRCRCVNILFILYLSLKEKNVTIEPANTGRKRVKQTKQNKSNEETKKQGTYGKHLELINIYRWLKRRDNYITANSR